MATAGQPSLNEAMNRLWTRFLPQIEERVAVLETAASALDQGPLSPAQREEASSAAHKLAGVLGTFGLDEGTVLAREAEDYYSGEPLIDDAAGRRQAEIAGRLRDLVTARR
jgi:HPt (histidine-containing phosphotransfer) domain-containing protein